MHKWDSILNHFLKEFVADTSLFYGWDNLHGTYFLIFALLKENLKVGFFVFLFFFFKKSNPKPVTCGVFCCLV